MSAFHRLVRLLRVYRESRRGDERVAALRRIRDEADEAAAREETR